MSIQIAAAIAAVLAALSVAAFWRVRQRASKQLMSVQTEKNPLELESGDVVEIFGDSFVVESVRTLRAHGLEHRHYSLHSGTQQKWLAAVSGDGVELVWGDAKDTDLFEGQPTERIELQGRFFRLRDRLSGQDDRGVHTVLWSFDGPGAYVARIWEAPTTQAFVGRPLPVGAFNYCGSGNELA